MVPTGRSDFGEAAIKHRATEFFVGGLGLEIVSQTANAISFEGEAGTVNVTVSEDGPDSDVQILVEEPEREAAQFMETIAMDSSS